MLIKKILTKYILFFSFACTAVLLLSICFCKVSATNMEVMVYNEADIRNSLDASSEGDNFTFIIQNDLVLDNGINIPQN